MNARLARPRATDYIGGMTYVALLRGINVGGNNKIDMKALKTVFEAAGMTSVRTYINSGNVIFSCDTGTRATIATMLASAIERQFGLAIPVLVRDVNEMRSIVEALPAEWANDASAKCDVVFLWPEVDTPETLEALAIDSKVEDARYTPGAILRRVTRKNVTRSRLTRIVGTPLYTQVTLRNCTTARKLLALMTE